MRQLAAGALTLVLLTSGCGDRRAPATDGGEPPAAPAPQEAAPGSAPRARQTADAPQRVKALGYVSAATLSSQAEAEPVAAALLATRKLIRTGQLELEVEAFPAAAAKATRVAAEHGGYVADSKQTRSDSGRRQGSLVLRVPAERFANALEALRALGTVRAENVAAQDITKAYADLETRLRVKRETLERLRDILRRQTGKLQDVLEVEREIARVTEEIEQAEGERRYYDQLVALSTITLELAEPAPLMSGGAFDVIGEALRQSLRVLAGSVAALVFVAAAGLPWLLLAFTAVRLFRWRRRRKAQPPAAG